MDAELDRIVREAARRRREAESTRRQRKWDKKRYLKRTRLAKP